MSGTLPKSHINDERFKEIVREALIRHRSLSLEQLHIAYLARMPATKTQLSITSFKIKLNSCLDAFGIAIDEYHNYKVVFSTIRDSERPGRIPRVPGSPLIPRPITHGIGGQQARG